MTKTEAAEILVSFIATRARQLGVRVVDKDFIEATRSEARHHGAEGSRLRAAALLAPHWTTIRAAARNAGR